MMIIPKRTTLFLITSMSLITTVLFAAQTNPVFTDQHNYKASGPIFTTDFNGAFFIDNQDPSFTVIYKDADGNAKQRTYQANISLIGLNIELALRANMIFFVGTDFNFAQTNKVIELGTGIQICPTQSWIFFLPAALDATYIPFNNAAGGMVILSLILGFKMGGLSVVTGGTLTPIATTT